MTTFVQARAEPSLACTFFISRPVVRNNLKWAKNVRYACLFVNIWRISYGIIDFSFNFAVVSSFISYRIT